MPVNPQSASGKKAQYGTTTETPRATLNMKKKRQRSDPSIGPAIPRSNLSETHY
jgi:hypothetical protein